MIKCLTYIAKRQCQRSLIFKFSNVVIIQWYISTSWCEVEYPVRILQHVINEYQWLLLSSDGSFSCKHGPLSSDRDKGMLERHLLFKEWFSPGTPASSTTKTGRHDIAEILLKVAINTIIHSFNQKKNECIITGIVTNCTQSVDSYLIWCHYIRLFRLWWNKIFMQLVPAASSLKT
jgi:hypothetical protein